MVFRRTTASVFDWRELPITRERDIFQVLTTYEEQQQSGGEPDRALLEKARALLQRRLDEHTVDFELVHLAQTLYSELGEYQAEIAVLRRYLAASPDPSERAWAWWHLIDCLALDNCAQEVVAEQPAFLAWALTAFPAEECFFVIADGTQARAWLAAGVGSEWLKQCQELFKRATWTKENRLDRFYCLRTSCRIVLDLHAFEEVRASLLSLHNLLLEDRHWSDGWWVAVEVSLLEMIEAQTRGDIEHMRACAQEIIGQLACWEEVHVRKGGSDPDEVGRFRSLAHNAAAPLYRAKQYDLAIPLLRRAVAYHTIPYQSYLWLAASLWATTHERDRVLPLLRQAATRFDSVGSPWSAFQHLPEFADAPFWGELV